MFYGILTDTVMSFIIGPLELGFSGVDQHSSFLSISILLLGSASVVLGAYVTASFSRQQWIANVVAHTSCFSWWISGSFLGMRLRSYTGYIR